MASLLRKRRVSIHTAVFRKQMRNSERCYQARKTNNFKNLYLTLKMDHCNLVTPYFPIKENQSAFVFPIRWKCIPGVVEHQRNLYNPIRFLIEEQKKAKTSTLWGSKSKTMFVSTIKDAFLLRILVKKSRLWFYGSFWQTKILVYQTITIYLSWRLSRLDRKCKTIGSEIRETFWFHR